MGLRISGFRPLLLNDLEALCSFLLSFLILLLFLRVFLIHFLCFPAASAIAPTTAAMAFYKRSLSTTRLVNFTSSTPRRFLLT